MTMLCHIFDVILYKVIFEMNYNFTVQQELDSTCLSSPEHGGNQSFVAHLWALQYLYMNTSKCLIRSLTKRSGCILLCACNALLHLFHEYPLSNQGMHGCHSAQHKTEQLNQYLPS